jgi:hypothetical protein
MKPFGIEDSAGTEVGGTMRLRGTSCRFGRMGAGGGSGEKTFRHSVDSPANNHGAHTTIQSGSSFLAAALQTIPHA